MKNKEKKLLKNETRNETKIKKKGKKDNSKKNKNEKKKENLEFVEKIDVNETNADMALENNKKQDDTYTNTLNTKESSLLNESKNNEYITLDPTSTITVTSASTSISTSTSTSTSSFFDFIKNSIEQRIPNVGRDLSTSLSIAIPSTIINQKNDVVKAYITSYLARICTIFSIERIYIYDDQIRYEKETLIERNGWDGNWKNETKEENRNNRTNKKGNEEKSNRGRNGKNENISNTMNTIDNMDNMDTTDTTDIEYSYLCKFLHYNLQYLETPQYLRKHLFPITPFLKNTGIMNPVDAPHHLRSDEWLPFREGVIVEKKENGLIVDVGLFSNAFIKTENSEEQENSLCIGTRVTVLFDETSYNNFKKRNKSEKIIFTGKLISPQIPLLYNVYWGYSIEVLKNVSEIFQLKFDYLVGTSERGTHTNGSCIFEKGKSILIVFGNKDGLENLLIREKEEKKKKNFSAEERQKKLKKILKKFDFFLNTCPFQTSRTIRTEEAITITLSTIHNVLK